MTLALLGAPSVRPAAILPIRIPDAISPDGRVAACHFASSVGIGSPASPVRTTLTTTLSLPTFEGYEFSQGRVSQEGRVFAGLLRDVAFTINLGKVALYRWTPSGGHLLLDPAPLPGKPQSLRLSEDGGTLAGQLREESCCPQPRGQAFRWTSPHGFSLHPQLGDVAALSADGSILLGPEPENAHRLGRLDLLRGYQVIAPPDSGQSPKAPFAAGALMTADGNAVVCLDDSPDRALYRWRSGVEGWERLGSSPVGAGLELAGMTSDTRTVVGKQAWIWREGVGTETLSQYLTSQGVNLTGWTLQTCVGVSADGKVFVGTAAGIGSFPAGLAARGWMVILDDRHLAQPISMPTTTRPAVALEVQTRAGNRYHLERSSKLADWQAASPEFVGDGHPRSFWFPTDLSNDFFRMLEKP